jgi:hypothetical protein
MEMLGGETEGSDRWRGTGAEIGSDEWRAEQLVLKRRLGEPDLLLTGRVGDFLVDSLRTLSRYEDRNFAEIVTEIAPVVTVRKVPLPMRVTRRKLFPMRVVIHARRPALLRRALERFEPPPGIGIDIAAGSAVLPHSHGECTVGGGRPGTVAGSVVDGSGRVRRLTCAHVVSPSCLSTRPSPPPARRTGTTYMPDAVLLNGESACFPAEDLQPITPAASDQIDLLVSRNEMVRRTGGGRSGSGRLHARVDGYPDSHGDGLCRFPSLIVDPRRRTLLFWPSPFRGRSFSKDGDSGSWVLAEDGDLWVGMVVSGTPDRSFAHDVAPLMAWLEETEPGGGEWTCMCSPIS